MKSKCSFILKAGLSLVLCFVLLFGTMATGFSAVVKNPAETGAKVDIAETGYQTTTISSGEKIYLDTSKVYSSWGIASKTVYLALFYNGANNSWNSNKWNDIVMTQDSNNPYLFYWSPSNNETPSGFKFYFGSDDNKYQYGTGDITIGDNWVTIPFSGENTSCIYLDNTTNWTSSFQVSTPPPSQVTIADYATTKAKATGYGSGTNASPYLIKSGTPIKTSATITPATGASGAQPRFLVYNGSTTTTGDWITSGTSSTVVASAVAGTTYRVQAEARGHYSSTASYSTVTSDYIYYYTLSEKTVTYDENGGTGTVSDQTKFEGIDLTLASSGFTRDGYTLSGWNTADDGSGTGYALGATYSTDSNLTLYAVWTEDTHTVSIAAAANGKTSTDGSVYDASAKSVTVGIDSTANIYAQADSNYTFTGWTSSDDAHTDFGDSGSASTTVKATADGITITANFTLSSLPVTTDVYSTSDFTNATPTYSSDAGAGSIAISPALSDGYGTYNAAYDFTATANTGYTFVGFVDDNDVAYTTSGDITVSGNVLTIAHLTAATHVRARFKRGATVTFNDGTSNITNYTNVWYDYGTGTTVPTAPVAGTDFDVTTGYDFSGWDTAVTAIGAQNSYTYTAQYAIKTYTVTATALGMDTAGAGYAVTLANAPTVTVTTPGPGTAVYDYGDIITFEQQTNSGYQFVGYVVVNDATSTAAASLASGTAYSATDTQTLNSLTANNCYHIYALYKKIYYITLYNTYRYDEEAREFIYISAPPKTFTVSRGGDTIVTYSYSVGTLAQRGEDNKYNSVKNSAEYETHVLNETGTHAYYEGNVITVLAGDVVTATYSALASSDTISAALFNNSIRYTTEPEPDDLYTQRAWSGYTYDAEEDEDVGDGSDDTTGLTHLYTPAYTLFADPNYYDTTDTTNHYDNIETYKNSYAATVNNDAHTVTWTVAGNYYNVELELATKKQITFTGEGVTVTSKNTDNYYSVGEAISATGDDTGLKVAATSSSSCTYTLGTPVYYTTDGKIIVTALPDPLPDGKTAADYKVDSTFSIGYDSETGKFSGNMPKYDVVIDMNVSVTYTAAIGSWIIADPVNQTTTTSGFNKWNKVASVRGTSTFTDETTTQSDTSYDVVDALRASVDSKTIAKGTSITYSTAFYSEDAGGNPVSYSTEYIFLGWYKGTTSGPTLSTGLLSTKMEYTYTPKQNVHIWAVGTRVMYIGGSFYDNDGVITYCGDGDSNATWKNHLAMSFDSTVGSSGAYTYTFDTVSNIADSGDNGYHFRVYEAETNSTNGEENATVWNRWASNGGTKYSNSFDTTHSLDYGRTYTSGEDNNSNGWDNYGWFRVDDAVIAGGYNAPVTVYFYPESGGIEVKSTFLWKMLYVSSGANGYENGTKITNDSSNTGSAPNLTCTVAGQSGAVVAASSYVWNPTGSYTNELNVTGYYVKTENGVVRVTKTTTSAVSVQAFVVYEYATGDVYAVDAVDAGSNTYYADITVSDHMYVYPVMKKTGATMRVYVNAADLDTTMWGKLISLDAWNSSSQHVNGEFPGQMMIPSDDGTWYADIVPDNLSGISFSNHYSGTWINNQLTNVQTVIPTYNTVTYNSSNYSNVNVQTYDYREPVSLKANYDAVEHGAGDKLILSFTIKNGNTNLTGYNTSSTDISSAFYSTFYNKSITPSSYTFEYLTDRTGKKYTDITGKELDGKPTPSFYVICKGNTLYSSGVNQNESGITYAAYDATYGGQWSVDWFVYDNAGNYITAVLSDGYAHQTSGLSVVATAIKNAGYAYEDRAVMISYDYPMSYSSNTTFRFSGQWYTTTAATPVTATVKVALEVGEDEDGLIITPSASYTDAYGTASISYVREGGAALDTTVPGSVTIKLSDAENKPVQISATETNFKGWYTYDEAKGWQPVANATRTFNPSFNADITYYAVYEAKASYKFKYLGRDGSYKEYTVDASNLTADEMGDGNIPRLDTELEGGTTRLAEAVSLIPAANYITVFEKTVTITATAENATESAYQILFDCTTTPKQYTLTYYYYSGSNASGWTSGSQTVAYGTAIDITGDVHTAVGYNGPTGQRFIGWYDAAEGGNLISTQANFGMAIVNNLTVYARYAASMPAAVASKQPTIEKNVLTLERTGAATGKYYNDFIVRYQNSGNEITASDCGILIIYQSGDAAMGEFSEANLTAVTNSLRTNTGKTANISSKNAKAFNITCDSLSIFNRIDLAFMTSYATTHGKAYTAYAYFWDGEAYTFSTVASGTYNL